MSQALLNKLDQLSKKAELKLQTYLFEIAHNADELNLLCEFHKKEAPTTHRIILRLYDNVEFDT